MNDVPSVTSLPLDDNASKKNKNWTAIAALIIAVITLIIAIVVAFVIIPNNQCSCSNTAATTSGAFSNDGPTIIINETDRYYVENVTVDYPSNGSCPTNTVGIININETYEVGGYYGWLLDTGNPEFYPMP